MGWSGWSAWTAEYHRKKPGGQGTELIQRPVVGWQFGEDPVGWVIDETDIVRADDPRFEAQGEEFTAYESAFMEVSCFLDDLFLQPEAQPARPWLVMELAHGGTVTGRFVHGDVPAAGFLEFEDPDGQPVFVKPDAIMVVRVAATPEEARATHRPAQVRQLRPIRGQKDDTPQR